jgi:predicted  nucleic acid-binding Zn-ribbon protein
MLLGAGHMYGCSQIVAPEYKALQLLDDANLIDIKTEIEKFLTYNQPLSNIPIKSILVRCETESFWDIFELENVQEVQEITNFDVAAELNQIKTEISSVIGTNIDDAVDNSFDGTVNEIDSFITNAKQLVTDASSVDLNAEKNKIDLTQIRSTLEGAISALNSQGATSMADRLEAIKSNELVNIENTLPQLDTEIIALSAEIAQLDTELTTVETDFTDVKTYLSGLSASIETDVLQYVDDLAAGIPNGLVEDISKALECDQFKINLDVLVGRGCDETAGQLHAVWFSGAICIGIMPIVWFTFMCMVKHF